ncbi:MAG: DNA polymerase III subunit delta [Elusimicrobia bacterium]|nr:DNA polymerase III subunit delta [Elusimicrobiota bacterium]MDE2313602.1 DNA polymerase III subunit delta [Elusimicrobiota bacterium]
MELSGAELAKDLKAGLRPVYYLLGEEAADKEAARRLVEKTLACDDFNARAFAGDLDERLGDILAELHTLPVFSDRRLVSVKAPAFPAALKKALAEYLKSPSPQTTLLLVSDDRKADAKDPLAQAAKSAGALIVFAPLREDAAETRLCAAAKKAGKTLPSPVAQLLVREAGTDWTALSQELEKLLLFCSGAEISEEDALACLGYRKAADPFALSRLIQERKAGPVLAHLRRFLADGKPQDQAFRAMAQMSSAVQKQLRAKILAGAGRGPQDIARTLRLHPYWDRDFVGRASRLGEKRLREDLLICLRTERALKSQSWLDPQAEVEAAAARLCRAK